MGIHWEEEVLYCEACRSAFSLINSLKNYMLTHTGEELFSNKDCE